MPQNLHLVYIGSYHTAIIRALSNMTDVYYMWFLFSSPARARTEHTVYFVLALLSVLKAAHCYIGGGEGKAEVMPLAAREKFVMVLRSYGVWSTAWNWPLRNLCILRR